MSSHFCIGHFPGYMHGSAFDCCVERNGYFWVDNGEYASMVNFCPFCGTPAPNQWDQRLADRWHLSYLQSSPEVRMAMTRWKTGFIESMWEYPVTIMEGADE